MASYVQDVIDTIKQAQGKIGGDGSTFFTDWEVVLTEQVAFLAAVLPGFKLEAIVTLLERLDAMWQASQALYAAQCQFDYACTDAVAAL
jgi:hypothetical protein